MLLEYETSRRLLKPSGGVITRCLLQEEFENTGWRGSIDVRDATFTHETQILHMHEQYQVYSAEVGA